MELKKLRVARYVGKSLVLLTLWFSYVVKISLGELLIGILGIGGTLFLTEVVLSWSRSLFVGWEMATKQVWRIPWYALQGTYVAFHFGIRKLFRPLATRGRLRAVPFDTGGPDRQSQARRILGLTLPTLTPNSIALGFVPNRHLLFLHQLQPTKVNTMIRKLGASS